MMECSGAPDQFKVERAHSTPAFPSVRGAGDRCHTCRWRARTGRARSDLEVKLGTAWTQVGPVLGWQLLQVAAGALLQLRRHGAAGASAVSM